MFDGTTKPLLPIGFIDRSEKNDICSHYELEVGEHIIAVWVNFDNPDRREEDWQYAVGIRKNEEDEYENGSFVYFDEPNLHTASLRIFKEVSNLIRRYCMEKATHDKSFLFESLKKLSETQIGARRYFVEDKKILEGIDLAEIFNIVLNTVVDKAIFALSTSMVDPEYTSDYWDCNCDVEYIHPSTTQICPACKAERTNQPYSKISELKQENMFIYTYKE